jgi:flagellar motility protein MotE (MotC chaperone)
MSKSMGNLLTRYTIPVIIVMKIGVLSYIFLGDKKIFWLGDKSVVAQESAPEAAPEAEAEPVDGGKRKGFLDDLLNLPKIDSENLKKDEVGRYLTLLERKQSQVENRLQVLKAREDQLKSLEDSVDAKLKKLEEEMAFFQQTIQKEKDIQKDRLDKLVEFYQKMDAKKAAPVFEKLDKDLVVALFNRIPQKQTTTILQLMNPDKSVELSEYYGRIRSAKEYEMLKEINTTLRKEFAECKGMPEKTP